nr:hypothetical protein Iba_scaffold18234CG0020 [Ipomoea batatas]
MQGSIWAEMHLCSCHGKQERRRCEMSTDEEYGGNTRFGHWAIVAWRDLSGGNGESPRFLQH